MNLPEPAGEVLPVQKRGVGDLHIGDAVPTVFPRDPKQQILVEGVGAVAVIGPVQQDLPGVGAHLPVRQRLHADAAEGVLRLLRLGEDVAVEIDLLQIRKDGLAVLGDGQRVADAVQIPGRPLGIAEDQLGKVEKGVVVDAALAMLAGELEIAELSLGLHAPRLQRFQLRGRAFQPQLLDIVIRIADLVADAQGDEHVRRQDAVHVGVQVGAELAVGADVGLHDGLLQPQPVVLGLAHQGFGNGGDGGLQLHPAVGVDVGDLGAAEAQDIHLPVVAVVVTGDLPADDLQPVFVLLGVQGTEPGQVRDEVAGVVVRRADDVEKPLALHGQLHRDVLLPIQIKLSECDHVVPPETEPFSSFWHPASGLSSGRLAGRRLL